MPGNSDLKRRLPVLLPPPGSSDEDDDDSDDAGRSTPGMESAMPGSPSSSIGDDNYAEDAAKFVRLRRRVAALRACRMITVWPADDDDRVSGR